jgi:hypothetical protein
MVSPSERKDMPVCAMDGSEQVRIARRAVGARVADPNR